MIKGHTHVIKTTADKLAEELDSWLERPDDPDAATSTDYTVTHTGGRDWVIVLRHSEHDDTHPHGRDSSVKPVTSQKEYIDWLAFERSTYWNQCVGARTALKDAGWPEAAVGTTSSVDLAAGIRWLAETAERKWEPTVSLEAFSRLGLVAGEYEDKTGVDSDGVRRPSDIAGWVEDRDGTWIMWIDRVGRPHCLWTERDESGGVVGDSYVFGADGEKQAATTTDPWLLLTTRHTAKWGDVLPGDVLDWSGSSRVVQRTTPTTLPNGVGVVHVQIAGGEGYEFVIRGVHETAYVITRLDKQDLEWALRGEFGQLSVDRYRGRD